MFGGGVRGAERDDIPMGKHRTCQCFLVEPLLQREGQQTEYPDIPAESYYASLCGIESGIEAVGFDYDTIAIEEPVPDIRREGTSTGREFGKDLYVPQA